MCTWPSLCACHLSVCGQAMAYRYMYQPPARLLGHGREGQWAMKSAIVGPKSAATWGYPVPSGYSVVDHCLLCTIFVFVYFSLPQRGGFWLFGSDEIRSTSPREEDDLKDSSLV